MAAYRYRPPRTHRLRTGRIRPRARGQRSHVRAARRRACNRGRTFAAGEDHAGSARVVVLSHALWQRHYHADPGVVGRSVLIDDVAYTVVGVMPVMFHFPTAVPGAGLMGVEAWIPLRQSSDLDDRGSHNYWVVGRLAPASLSNVPAQRWRRLAIVSPVSTRRPNKDFAVAVEPLKQHVAGTARPALLLFLATVGFVLLLTCVNIANLLLVRSEARRREMAMRQALGASSRPARPAGIDREPRARRGRRGSSGLAVGSSAVFASLSPSLLAASRVWIRPRSTRRSWLSCWRSRWPRDFCSVSIPARFGSTRGRARRAQRRRSRGWRRNRADPARPRLSASRAGADASRRLGIARQELHAVAGLDLGFRAPHVLTAVVVLSPARYGESAHQVRFVDELLRRMQTVPGVSSAAVSHTIPMTGINDQGGFAVEGRPDSGPDFPPPHANRPHVSAAYFDTMGIRLLAGRLFDDRDGPNGTPVAIVSELAVRRYWPAGSPLGRRLATDWGADGKPVWRQIVGVVHSTRHFGLEAPQKAEVYLPFAQAPVPFVTLVVRTTGNPKRVRERDSRAGQRDRSAAVRVRLPDDGRAGDRVRRATSIPDSARRDIRRARVDPRGSRHLRGDGLHGDAAASRNRRPARSRRTSGRGCPDGPAKRPLAHTGRRPVGLAGTVARLARALGLPRTASRRRIPATYVAMIGVLVAVAVVAAYRPSRRAATVDPLVVLGTDRTLARVVFGFVVRVLGCYELRTTDYELRNYELLE